MSRRGGKNSAYQHFINYFAGEIFTYPLTNQQYEIIGIEHSGLRHHSKIACRNLSTGKIDLLPIRALDDFIFFS